MGVRVNSQTANLLAFQIRVAFDADVFEATSCSAALAAGIFHRNEVEISEVKDHMRDKDLPTRV